LIRDRFADPCLRGLGGVRGRYVIAAAGRWNMRSLGGRKSGAPANGGQQRGVDVFLYG
jgi:hypothetical protein